jgi:hypothetical protein
MSEMSIVPVPAEQAGATCAHCGAALVADQRYCLSCGQPASPVRLAFLDVLQNDQAAGVAGPTLEMTPANHAPFGQARGANGWLRRNSGLLSLLAVLVLCLIAGLLIGHWVSQSHETPSKQVVEVKVLSGLAAAPAAATTSSAAGGTTGPAAKATAKEADAKQAEAKETKAEKAPPPEPKKVAPAKIKKLTNSSGAQHQKEIDELGAQPIETG